MEKICGYCHRPVKSGYVRYDDGTICCVSCKEYYPICFLCSKPARQHIIQDEKVVCTECAQSLHRCVFCQKYIVGRAYKFGETRFCEACYNQADKCQGCGIPISVLPVAGTGKICKACFERLPRCSFCGKSILSQVWKNESEKLMACAECYQKVGRCYRCGVPLKTPHYFYGKTYCARCSSPGSKPAAPRPEKRESPQPSFQPLEPLSGKQYTFLVVSPTNGGELKMEKEALLVNNCFKNYHEYVKQNVEENRGILVSTADETILCLFDAAEDAVKSAGSLLAGMENFNKHCNKLPQPLHIRIGLNSIEKAAASSEGKMKFENLYGSITDLAHKVLELAEQDTALITQQTYDYLDKSRPLFLKNKKISDLHLTVMTYRLEGFSGA